MREVISLIESAKIDLEADAKAGVSSRKAIRHSLGVLEELDKNLSSFDVPVAMEYPKYVPPLFEMLVVWYKGFERTIYATTATFDGRDFWMTGPVRGKVPGYVYAFMPVGFASDPENVTDAMILEKCSGKIDVPAWLIDGTLHETVKQSLEEAEDDDGGDMEDD